MRKTDLESALEALLFYSGDSISSKKLKEVCNSEEITIHMAIYRLNEFYKKTNSGIEIVELEDGYQMCTAPAHLEYIQRFKQKPVRKLLTQALLETLAIVAYSQPITRTQIEEIRGVRSEHALVKLVEYGLIEEVGRLGVIGRPILFGTTHEFLRHFNFRNLDELPTVKEELIEKFKQEVEQEMDYFEDRESQGLGEVELEEDTEQ